MIGSGRRRIALDETGSTNSHALSLARAGEPAPFWVTARRQLEGRGRRGRAWASETGNLYASHLSVEPAPLADISKLPLVACVAVADAVAALVPHPDRVSVKWPNDVMIDGRKTVGILLESERLGDGTMALVIGCGLNVRHAPDDVPYGVTCLAREGSAADVEAAFGALSEAMETTLRSFDRGAGFASIRRRWLSLCAGVGRPCRVNLADRSVDGRFEELDADGRLVLQTETGQRLVVAAGDLFYLDRDERHPA